MCIYNASGMQVNREYRSRDIWENKYYKKLQVRSIPEIGCHLCLLGIMLHNMFPFLRQVNPVCEIYEGII